MPNEVYFDVLPGRDGQYRWHLIAGNGKSVAIGGEGFTRDEDAWRAAHDLPIWAAAANFSREIPL